jgi:curli biogenesis system outer membrane secretion channel CsgG
MKQIVVISVLVIILVALSGCLSSPVVRESAQGALHSHYEYSVGWSPGQGCYERVTGYVYNAGNTSLDAVLLNLNLVNTGTGTIRDSRSIFIGPVGTGETRTYETILDGECTQEYQVDFAFGK